ncbi:hypothetical protein lerEdw1_014732 [Lerista edwardsae]|nr:hypothetical protein lerEdw1_014735 [Lerista edwardsae]KAJ6628035.1 hypothetical protein lerEdw1_014732 [Lerista edwardsae]
MNRILLLSITILGCCALAEALTCRVCRRYKIGVGCVKKESTCVPKKGYHCSIVAISEDERRGFVSKGCTRPTSACGTTVTNEELGLVTTQCCDDGDFCNEE